MLHRSRSMALTAAVLAGVIVLAGCGSTSGSGEARTIVRDEPTAAAAEAAQETQDQGSAEAVASSPTEQPEDSAASSASTDVTIEEQVLIDQDGVKVTATEYVTDMIWGEGIKLMLENDTSKDITVGCTALIVNDYMISDLFVSNVAAGKKSNDKLYLSSSGLKAAGIDNVGQIEIYFHVYDSDSFETLFDPDCVTIRTSAYDQMDTTPDDAGTELYQADGIRIVGKAVDENSFWGSAILLYCENNSGRNVGITVEDMSINGFMMTPYFSSTVYDGKKALDDITILSTELESNGINSIDEVELKFHMYDVDTFDTIADTDPITFSAK
ncbi:MAG: hypothetical protein IJ917_07130 [Firmicutes bacterium]|nr:hypothetical protein [Bacillota bacterium]